MIIEGLKKFTWLLFLISGSVFLQGQTWLREDFNSLERWSPLTFPKIDHHSQYQLISGPAGEGWLEATSDHAASGLVFQDSFDIYAYPLLRWRWKVDAVIPAGNAEEKAGDDYPLRLYVIFQYEEEKADFLESLLYKSLKMIYDQTPPFASLNYIWVNRRHDKTILPNPFTDRAQMILVEQGPGKAGQWVEEKTNLIQDYRQAFGEDPPRMARLAIMTDSDNTGSRTRAWLDYIEIARR